METGIFLLEDGTCWTGKVFGSLGEVFGEAVFNTAFSGYEEVLTDPSYAGQIVVMATPHLGNYGISLEDMESSRCYLKGFVVKDLSPTASSWRARKTLNDFLSDQFIIGLYDVDTRGIVKHLRAHGAMRAALSTTNNPDALLEAVGKSPSMLGANFMSEVTTGKIEHYENPGKRLVLFDFGLKRNILRNLLARQFEIFVVPAYTKPDKVLELKPDGLVFSNGPGDPAALGEIVDPVRSLLKTDLPMLGICLGHQILALALGGKTYKLKFGHRGVNHPVKHLESGLVSITSHNHGFAVDQESLGTDLVPTYVDLYDGTLEGFRHAGRPVFGVQFHPEAAPGPHDALQVFDQFWKVVGGSNTPSLLRYERNPRL